MAAKHLLRGLVMYIINRLRTPGKIKSIKLTPEVVVVRTADNEEIVYRRIENESVQAFQI